MERAKRHEHVPQPGESLREYSNCRECGREIIWNHSTWRWVLSGRDIRR